MSVPARRLLPLILMVAMLPVTPVATDGDGGWQVARPGYPWSFPEDHWAHPGYRTEWWYLTGHLETTGEPRRRFGYQFTFFRVGVLAEAPDFASRWSASGLVMGHMSVTDITGRRHRFGELLHRQTPFLGQFSRYPEQPIAWSRGPAGTGSVWTLRWNGEGFDVTAADDRQDMALSLTTRPARPPVFHGPGGYSRKGATGDAASLYYSFTRLETEGQVVLDGTVFPVEGESWMDREFSSSQLTGTQVGWDWFSLQLEDGRDLMLYILRDRRGEVDFGRGTLVHDNGRTTELSPGDWTVTATGQWTSPRTGTTYPSGWRVALPAHGLDLDVRPVLAGQENATDAAGGIHYWEGAVDAFRSGGGDPVGRGYVELTGYGENSRPPI